MPQPKLYHVVMHSDLQFPYWCLYFTKLAPIFKTDDNVPRAERVVALN